MSLHPAEDETARVEDDPQRFRYEVKVGDQLAGFAQYQRSAKQVAFTHTEIDPEFEGRGLGSLLIRNALEDSREHGREVLPYCPFVKAFIERHPEYQALVGHAD
jgi:predicted GNAT family acetyltransferase